MLHRAIPQNFAFPVGLDAIYFTSLDDFYSIVFNCLGLVGYLFCEALRAEDGHFTSVLDVFYSPWTSGLPFFCEALRAEDGDCTSVLLVFPAVFPIYVCLPDFAERSW